MTSSIIHGHHLEVTVVGCNIFSESCSRSHPLYSCFEYDGNYYHITIPTQDGGTNTTYSNKFDLPLIEGQKDLKFVIWKNIDTNFHSDDFMGSGWVQLHNIISQGSEESSCTFQKGNNRNITGELKLVLQSTHPQSQKCDPSSSSAKFAPQSHKYYPYSSHNSSSNPTFSYWPPPIFYHSSSYPSPYPHHPHVYPSPPPYQYPPPPSYYPPPPPPPSHPPQSPIQRAIPMVASLASFGASLFQLFGG